MQILTTLLLITGFAALLGALPQLLKLIKLKHTAEFSLYTWAIWLTYQIMACVYIYLLGAYIYFLINVLWACFYLTMVFLIIHYRRKPGKRRR